MPVNARVGKLLQLLSARTRPDGTPLAGYASNVAAIKAELEQLQARETQRSASAGAESGQ